MRSLSLFALVASLSLASAAVTLPKYFKNRIVLQAGNQPANVFGTTDDTATPITVHLACTSGLNQNYNGVVTGNNWDAAVGPGTNGDSCTVTVTQGAQVITLTDVVFGDVYICSGQSNMEWSINNSFNATEEIAASAEFTNIRFYRVGHLTSAEEQNDLISEASTTWEDSSNGGALGGFSAVCYYYARHISRLEGKRTFGLIQSAWGGTRIEPWTPQEALTTCNVPPNVEEGAPQNSNTYLYNAMIHPFVRFAIKGALWYQGESNTGWNRDLYDCVFAEMIRSWRTRWNLHSGSDPAFPFGNAQLASNNPTSTSNGFPLIRWYQTAEHGYVPNDLLVNVFQAVTLDTHDPEGGIHPRNKQLVGERLAVAGLNVAYGLTQYPQNGPIPTSVTHNLGFVTVVFDKPFVYTPVENSGFYSCNAATYDQCDAGSGVWAEVSRDAVVQQNEVTLVVTLAVSDTGIAYLWRESPVMGTKALPIYSTDAFQLPAVPFKWGLL